MNFNNRKVKQIIIHLVNLINNMRYKRKEFKQD